MKELESVLKIVEEGLRTLAKGVNAIADRLDEIAKPPAKAKPKRKTSRKGSARGPRTERTTRETPKAKTPTTAADAVLSAIRKSRKPVDTAALMQKTGFDRKKIQNTVFKLRKEGKIKNLSKGVYIKV